MYKTRRKQGRAVKGLWELERECWWGGGFKGLRRPIGDPGRAWPGPRWQRKTRILGWVLHTQGAKAHILSKKTVLKWLRKVQKLFAFSWCLLFYWKLDWIFPSNHIRNPTRYLSNPIQFSLAFSVWYFQLVNTFSVMPKLNGNKNWPSIIWGPKKSIMEYKTSRLQFSGKNPGIDYLTFPNGFSAQKTVAEVWIPQVWLDTANVRHWGCQTLRMSDIEDVGLYKCPTLQVSHIVSVRHCKCSTF